MKGVDETTDQGLRRVIDGRYELVELLGTGGMAEVWRAFDRRLRRDVALKLLSGPSARAPSSRKRIEREARALAAVSHPNIVAVYDYGEATDEGGSVLPYVVMELIEGPDLHEHLARRGPLPFDEVRSLLGSVLSAVERAHTAGIVHGDLKPANVLIDNGVPKVGDFGVARIFSEETGTTTVAVTPTFAAPEVLRGERVTESSDIYSAACLAFQMLTGHPPYEGANAWEVAAKHMEDPVPHATGVRDDVPVGLDEAVRHGMDKMPRRRFASAAEFREAIASPHPTLPVAALARSEPPEPTEVIAPGPDLHAAVLYGPLAPWKEKAATRWRALTRRVHVVPLAIAAVMLALFVAFMLSLRGTSTLTVPDVRGQTAIAGAAALRRAGLDVQGVSYTPISSGHPGRIVRTIPGAGEFVEPGATVHIIATALAAPTPGPVVTQQTNGNSEVHVRSGKRHKEQKGD